MYRDHKLIKNRELWWCFKNQALESGASLS